MSTLKVNNLEINQEDNNKILISQTSVDKDNFNISVFDKDLNDIKLLSTTKNSNVFNRLKTKNTLTTTDNSKKLVTKKWIETPDVFKTLFASFNRKTLILEKKEYNAGDPVNVRIVSEGNGKYLTATHNASYQYGPKTGSPNLEIGRITSGSIGYTPLLIIPVSDYYNQFNMQLIPSGDGNYFLAYNNAGNIIVTKMNSNAQTLWSRTITGSSYVRISLFADNDNQVKIAFTLNGNSLYFYEVTQQAATLIFSFNDSTENISLIKNVSGKYKIAYQNRSSDLLKVLDVNGSNYTKIIELPLRRSDLSNYNINTVLDEKKDSVILSFHTNSGGGYPSKGMVVGEITSSGVWNNWHFIPNDETGNDTSSSSLQKLKSGDDFILFVCTFSLNTRYYGSFKIVKFSASQNSKILSFPIYGNFSMGSSKEIDSEDTYGVLIAELMNSDEREELVNFYRISI